MEINSKDENCARIAKLIDDALTEYVVNENIEHRFLYRMGELRDACDRGAFFVEELHAKRMNENE